MSAEPERTRAARRAAETALVRIVHHYGERPGFVLLGGLVPELLCSQSAFLHAGTTDVDVQVDLEIASGAVNMSRLEVALRNAEFEPTPERVWRWSTEEGRTRSVIKFELLADVGSQPAQAVVTFDGCRNLGAVNLRGTGFAARDTAVRPLSAKVNGDLRNVEINVTGLAGFLLAKAFAAHSRRKPKDWYDIAFVLLHNNDGGVQAAAAAVLTKFGGELVGALKTALGDLVANFSAPGDQGPLAYASQMMTDHPEQDETMLRADAVLAVTEFYAALFPDAEG